MKNKISWLRILNVDQGEWWLVRNLMILQFFQGAGIAFFFTASFASFLNEMPITELPWVMILSSVLLWVTGYIRTRAEQTLSMPRLTLVVTSFMLFSILFFRFAEYAAPGKTLLYWMLAWFNVLYLLNNLQFWGLAAPLFDLRQSKRLFGLISSGDIPAKFVGYSLASLAAKYMGTMNMLYVAAACMAISFPFIAAIQSARGQTGLPAQQQHHQGSGKQYLRGSVRVGALIRDFTKNIFIRNIALISMLAFGCLLLINYGFYSEVKQRSHDNKDLAAFIATFMAVIRLMAMIAKMLFTGRVMNHVGLRKTLLITPWVMLALMAVPILTQKIGLGENTIFYLFGASFILIEVCRTVFNSPGLITLMQPLPVHERLRAHNIIKGIMDPFAFLLTGIILLVLIRSGLTSSLLVLCYLVLAMGLIWLIGIWMVNRQYLQILLRTISSRYFSQEEFPLNDELIQEAIRNKISTGSELELIGILKMLSSKPDNIPEDIVLNLLQHDSPKVRAEMLKLLSGPTGPDTVLVLNTMADQDPDEQVRQDAVKAVAKTSAWDPRMRGYAESENPAIRKAALLGMLLNADKTVSELSALSLTQYIRSERNEDKLFAASILQDSRDVVSHPLLHELLADPDSQVKDMAISAMGKAADRNSIRTLLAMLPQHGNTVLRALEQAGPDVVDIISEAIRKGAYRDWEEKLIGLIGRHGGEPAQQELLRLLQEDPSRSDAIIKALHRANHRADEKTQLQLEALARSYISRGVELMHMQRMLGNLEDHRMLRNALDLELEKIRDLLLCLFGCMFEPGKIKQAKHGLESRSPGNMANAMEILELTVKKDIGRYFNAMFENTSLEHRCDALSNLLKASGIHNVAEIITRILHDKPIAYQHWTKACSLYITGKQHYRIDPVLIQKYAGSDNPMVRETAQNAREIV